MLVHIVADNPTKLAGVRSLLQKRYDITSELLNGVGVQRSEMHALVVKADLRVLQNISALRKVLDSLPNVDKRIFLIDDAAHLSTSQAYALGASCVLQGQLNQAKLLKELANCLPAEPSPVDAQSAQAAANAGEIALASMFTAVASGAPVDVASARRAGGRISDAIDELGLSKWLATVRKHHEGTYQHCLLVTGLAVDFGLSLGFPKRDIERLHSAAMFHDIGKATIPLAVLDKPGRLDEGERALIETHPGAGYDILKDNDLISPEILDAVRHHHEYLDGSGYPDKLCAQSIGDLVRVLTISDIFAALIEDRRYKPPMRRADAYNILCGMHGKLERALVAAFKDVALSR
ncbi:MAG TPA: HD domain-containing phosphohydrolase [Bradyrhizobium sp.]|jgi:putative nucleotidyltransferase with HDIG domain